MVGYKCPFCGREELKVSEGQLEGSDFGSDEGRVEGIIVKCQSCGWFGAVRDLKPVG